VYTTIRTGVIDAVVLNIAVHVWCLLRYYLNSTGHYVLAASVLRKQHKRTELDKYTVDVALPRFVCKLTTSPATAAD
jgi:hypothetical protein